MRELRIRKSKDEVREYMHLVSREGRLFERRGFVDGLVKILDSVIDPANSGRDVVLFEKIVRFEHEESMYEVLVVEKGYFSKVIGGYIGLRYVDVPGIIIGDRTKRMLTKDGMEFEVSEVKPVPYNTEIRNKIKEKILEFNLVDKKNADKDIHYW